jgi:IS30 family transposase
MLVTARSGLNITPDEMHSLDALVSPLLKNGQSIYHICVTQRDALIRSSRSLYRFVGAGLFSARPIDMPRMCRLKPRRTGRPSLKVDKACREGRSYADFTVFIAAHPDTPVVQMDTVIGTVGGKVLLTLHLTAFDLMIAILRDANTSRSVVQALAALRRVLSPALFASLFPVLLTDNGSEFTNPSAMEFCAPDGSLTRVFYCDPRASYQKPNVELNHEFIRRFFPQGSSFDDLTQQDVSLMMSHVNSYCRNKFGGLSPASLLVNAFGADTLRLLGQECIPPGKITLNRSIFKR